MIDRPIDRRPVAARGWRPIGRLANGLIRRRASPDAISLLGMASACGAGILFSLAPSRPILWLAGAVLVQLRLLANVLDGMVAVGRGVASPVGELYNDVPDRISDTAVLAGLGWAAGNLALGLAAALAAIATAYVRVLGRAIGAPSDFRGPMAKQHRMALATAVAIVCVALPGWSAPIVTTSLWAITALALVTAARRLLGAARALRP